jgi:hypothetical protein
LEHCNPNNEIKVANIVSDDTRSYAKEEDQQTFNQVHDVENEIIDHQDPATMDLECSSSVVANEGSIPSSIAESNPAVVELALQRDDSQHDFIITQMTEVAMLELEGGEADDSLAPSSNDDLKYSAAREDSHLETEDIFVANNIGDSHESHDKDASLANVDSLSSKNSGISHEVEKTSELEGDFTVDDKERAIVDSVLVQESHDKVLDETSHDDQECMRAGEERNTVVVKMKRRKSLGQAFTKSFRRSKKDDKECCTTTDPSHDGKVECAGEKPETKRVVVVKVKRNKSLGQAMRRSFRWRKNDSCEK